MIDAFRMFKQVPRVVFGAGSIAKLPEIIDIYSKDDYVVYLLDHALNKYDTENRLPIEEDDLVYYIDTTHEPKVEQVDSIRDEILDCQNGKKPGLIVALGGGSTMDVGKAVSVILNNEGSSNKYQGWDLVPNPAVAKVAIPTLSGTGAEASRTAVLTAKDKKYGINSDHSMFDVVLMDADLIKTVPNEQRFYTGMDCYIHCVESLEGSFINEFGTVYAKSALELCRKYFLKEGGTDEELMVASYMGGASVANSEVGVAHAMSYGLSLILGYHHGIANCIAFNVLDEFYPDYMDEFKEMLKLNDITLPENVCRDVTDAQLDAMVEMTLKMERPLTSAIGENWKDVLTGEKIKELYALM